MQRVQLVPVTLIVRAAAPQALHLQRRVRIRQPWGLKLWGKHNFGFFILWELVAMWWKASHFLPWRMTAGECSFSFQRLACNASIGRSWNLEDKTKNHCWRSSLGSLGSFNLWWQLFFKCLISYHDGLDQNFDCSCFQWNSRSICFHMLRITLIKSLCCKYSCFICKED